MGPPGTGKTWSIWTLLAAGLEVFHLTTEPNAPDVVLEALNANNRQDLIAKYHYSYTSPSTTNWTSMLDLAKQINLQTFQALSDMKGGIAKPDSNQILQLLNQCVNFKDARTGESFGDVTTWGYDRALVLDSLSGLNELAKQNTVGLKPTMAPGEWGVAMNLEEMLINKLTSDMKCYFVLCAHVDRNINEVDGRMIITPSALGTKLGPKLGRFFSEVVMTVKKGDKFRWSTLEPNADVKQRALPISADLAPDFALVARPFAERLKLLS